MKVTIYTTTQCPFSKQEKEYLQGQNIAFEERNVETNREYLTEMLAVSNNFAGTPVTKVEKDDGAISILKGFTKEEFDTALGIVPVAAALPADSVVASPPVAAQPDSTAIPAPLNVPTTPSDPIVPPIDPVPPIEPTVAQAPLDTSPPAQDTVSAAVASVPSLPVVDDQPADDAAEATQVTPEPDSTLPPAPVIESPAPVEPTPTYEPALPTDMPAASMPPTEPKSEDVQAEQPTDTGTQSMAEPAAGAGSPQDSLNDILANLENKSTAQSLSETPTSEPSVTNSMNTQPPESTTPASTDAPAIPDPKF